MNKYEQLVEFIINDETDKARELFHNIVVEKSRDIYESLIDENDLNEVGGNQVEELVDEVSCDEEGLSEEEDMMGMDDEESDAMDFDDSGDLDDHEEEHGDVEARVDDLESALDELKAEFDALMAGEEGEEHMGNDMGSEEEAPEQFYESEEDDEEDEEELDETIVREYVEKVSAPSNTEGADNKTSIVAKKNDMGGSSANIAKGGEEKGAAKISPKGTLVNDPLNKPGAKAGNAFAKKESAKTKEESGVAKQSPLAK
jgi:hypothetical protein